MDILRFYLKFSKALKVSKGFTLIELLVAILMAGIVVTGLGTGMVALMNSSNTANTKANVKNQLNRAMDYINEDIKRSRFAGISTTNTTDDTLKLTYFENATDTTSHTIEYYMEASDNPWLGPNVIYRKVDGGTPQVLVDGITDNTLDDPLSCSTGTTGTNATTGFKACVETVESNRSVDVYRVSVSLLGEVSDKDEVEVSTKTIARSISPSLTPPTLALASDTDPTTTVNWSTVSGVTSYKVYRCTTASGQNSCTPTDLSTNVYSGSGTTWAETTDTSTGNRWCYSGISSDGVNTSRFGNVICAAVSTGGLPAATDLTASTDVLPLVSWGAANDATSYKLYRCAASSTSTCAPSSAGTAIATINAPTVTYTETTDPAASQKWCYLVTSVNANGTSADSNVDCGLVNSNATPNPPTLSLNASNSNILTWTDESASGATDYALYRCEASSGTTTCTPNILFTGFPKYALTETQATSATVDKRWCYGVTAINSTPNPVKTSSMSSPIVCGDVALATPSFTNTPYILSSPTVSWGTINGATSYELYRCTTTSSTCDPSAGTKVNGGTPNATTFTETSSPLNNERHCYAVKAKNNGGSSSLSTTECSAVKVAMCTVPNIINQSTTNTTERDAIRTQVTAAGFGTPTTINDTTKTVAKVWSVTPTAGSIVACSTAVSITWLEGTATTPPGAPLLTSVSGANVNNSTIAISWFPGGGGAATSYSLYKCTANSGTCNPQTGSVITPITTTSTTNVAPLNSTKNACYAVKATNAGGTSGFSNTRCDK